MHCKACDAPIPVSWRYVPEIDGSVLEDLCYHCLSTIRSTLNLVSPPDNMETIKENLEVMGIHFPEHDHEEAS